MFLKEGARETFDVTLFREPYRGPGGVFGGYRWLRMRLELLITGYQH